jgi:hypothetical protein
VPRHVSCERVVSDLPALLPAAALEDFSQFACFRVIDESSLANGSAVQVPAPCVSWGKFSLYEGFKVLVPSERVQRAVLTDLRLALLDVELGASVVEVRLLYLVRTQFF